MLLLQQPGRNLDGTCLPVDGHRLASAAAALAVAAAVAAFSILSEVVFDVAAIFSTSTFSASTSAHTLKIYKEGEEGGGGMHSIEVNKSYFIYARTHTHAPKHKHTHSLSRSRLLSLFLSHADKDPFVTKTLKRKQNQPKNSKNCNQG